MTDHESQQPPPGGYGGPPPTQPYAGAPQQPQYPQYPQAQYPQAQYPQAQYPGYPQPYGGYPQPYGYPPSYGPPPQLGPKRPGLVIASAVLAYVNAGLIILAGVLLLFGAAIVDDVEEAFDSNTNYSTEFTIDGILNLIMGGLLIAGAVGLTSGKASGRVILSVGNGLVIAAAVYWIVRFSDDRFSGANGNIVWGVVFVTLAILSLVFSFVGAVSRWMGEVRQT